MGCDGQNQKLPEAQVVSLASQVHLCHLRVTCEIFRVTIGQRKPRRWAVIDGTCSNVSALSVIRALMDVAKSEVAPFHCCDPLTPRLRNGWCLNLSARKHALFSDRYFDLRFAVDHH